MEREKGINFYSKIFVISLTLLFLSFSLALTLKYDVAGNKILDKIISNLKLVKEKIEQYNINNLIRITGYAASVANKSKNKVSSSENSFFNRNKIIIASASGFVIFVIFLIMIIKILKRKKKKRKTLDDVIKEIEEIEKKYRKGIIGKRKTEALKKVTKEKKAEKVKVARKEIVKAIQDRMKIIKNDETIIDVIEDILHKYRYISVTELALALNINKWHAENLANLLADAGIAKIKYTLFSTKIYLRE